MSRGPRTADVWSSRQGERMRHRAGAVIACIASLVGCDTFTEPDFRCTGSVPVGELRVVIGPEVGLFGVGAIVFVGDTLPLAAQVRPAVGASIDVWGSGGCKTDYGEAVPATIEWSTSDARIATVSATGVATGRQEGTVLITARDRSRGLAMSREIAVWVRGVGGS